MFNWVGNHKIGIFGMNNSGKTVFLTSLLWHLEKHDPDSKRFDLSRTGHISGFKLIEPEDRESEEHEFNFRKHKNNFVLENKWPEKTCDYAIARCKYDIKGEIGIALKHPVNSVKNFFIVKLGRQLVKRRISFLDIPGERLSDILIWKARDYQDWVKRIYKFWENDPETERIMKSFRVFVDNPKTTLAQLEEFYKRAMWSMIMAHCQITPSTYYLGTDGSMLGDKNNADQETAIRERPIWSGGNLLPLPESWGKKHPEEYQEMHRIFRAYRKQVLKPLFKEIDQCDNFIFCVDIPHILNSGPTYLLHAQETIQGFYRVSGTISHNPDQGLHKSDEAGLCRHEIRYGSRRGKSAFIAGGFLRFIELRWNQSGVLHLFRMQVDEGTENKRRKRTHCGKRHR